MIETDKTFWVSLFALFTFFALMFAMYYLGNRIQPLCQSKLAQVQSELQDVIQIKNECLQDNENNQISMCCSLLGSKYWYEDEGIVRCADELDFCPGIGDHDCIIHSCSCRLSGKSKAECIVSQG